MGFAVPVDRDGGVGLPIGGVEQVGLLGVADEYGALGVGFVEVLFTLGGLPQLGGPERQQIVGGAPGGQGSSIRGCRLPR